MAEYKVKWKPMAVVTNTESDVLLQVKRWFPQQNLKNINFYILKDTTHRIWRVCWPDTARSAWVCRRVCSMWPWTTWCSRHHGRPCRHAGGSPSGPSRPGCRPGQTQRTAPPWSAGCTWPSSSRQNHSNTPGRIDSVRTVATLVGGQCQNCSNTPGRIDSVRTAAILLGG